VIRNKKLSEEEFFKERAEVLAQWPTGKEVDLDEAIEYHKNLPPLKNYAKKLRYAKENNEISEVKIGGTAVTVLNGELIY